MKELWCFSLFYPPAKSLVVSFDLLSVFPSSIISAYMDQQEKVVVCGMDEIWQSFCDILNTGSRQTAHLPGLQIWMTTCFQENWPFLSQKSFVGNLLTTS